MRDLDHTFFIAKEASDHIDPQAPQLGDFANRKVALTSPPVEAGAVLVGAHPYRQVTEKGDPFKKKERASQKDIIYFHYCAAMTGSPRLK